MTGLTSIDIARTGTASRSFTATPFPNRKSVLHNQIQLAIELIRLSPRLQGAQDAAGR